VQPGEDRHDVGLGCMGEAIPRHQPADRVPAARTPSWPMKSSREPSSTSSKRPGRDPTKPARRPGAGQKPWNPPRPSRAPRAEDPRAAPHWRFGSAQSSPTAPRVRAGAR
jgi:hypothetical protein